MKNRLFMLMIVILCVAAYDPSGLEQQFVNDRANIISQEYESAITAYLQNLSDNTSIQIAVVTELGLEDEDIFDASLQAAEYLGVGQEDTDNGVVVFIAPDARKYQIQVGYGMEGVIPDIIAGRVGRNILAPAFQQGQYGQGILEAVQALGGYAQQDPAVIAQLENNAAGREELISLALIVIFIIIILVIASKTQGGSGGFMPILIPGPRMGGGMGGSFGGGFGGFGGGGFGGGGAGGGW